MTMQSENIEAIAKAVATMQKSIKGVAKDGTNPHFSSSYATLAACWDACHDAAAENGIAIVQTTDVEDGNAYLYTTLAHESGQWMRGRLPLAYGGNNPMQALGSAITYARRYGLCAAVGLAPEDDDGNSAHDGKAASKANGDAKKAAPKAPPPGVPAASQDEADEYFAQLERAIGTAKTPKEVDDIAKASDKRLVAAMTEAQQHDLSAIKDAQKEALRAAA
tara:strand:+ start:2088 stop:2750 length:663 start_codon:yes stop_codon:yes gene_type:complete